VNRSGFYSAATCNIETEETEMRGAKFCYEVLGRSQFDGFTREESYNGFACPYFNNDQAMLIMKAWEDQGLAARFDLKKDEFVFEVSGAEAPNDFQSFSAIYLDGLKLYPIGVFEWPWEEVTKSSF
jgi:hypothetical protein